MRKSILCILIALLAVGLFVSCAPEKATDPKAVKVFGFFPEGVKAATYEGSDAELDKGEWAVDQFDWYFLAFAPEDAENTGNEVTKLTQIGEDGIVSEDNMPSFFIGDKYNIYVYGYEKDFTGVPTTEFTSEGDLTEAAVGNAIFTASLLKEMKVAKETIDVYVNFTTFGRDLYNKGSYALLGFDSLVYTPWTTTTDAVKTSYTNAPVTVTLLVEGDVPKKDAKYNEEEECYMMWDAGNTTWTDAPAYDHFFQKVVYTTQFDANAVLTLTSASDYTTNSALTVYYCTRSDLDITSWTDWDKAGWTANTGKGLEASDKARIVGLYINSNENDLVYGLAADGVTKIPAKLDTEIYLYNDVTTYIAAEITGVGELKKAVPVTSLTFNINLCPSEVKLLGAADGAQARGSLFTGSKLGTGFEGIHAVINAILPEEYEGCYVALSSIQKVGDSTVYPPENSAGFGYDISSIDKLTKSAGEYKATIYPEAPYYNEEGTGVVGNDFELPANFFEKDTEYTVTFNVYSGDYADGTNYQLVAKTDPLTFKLGDQLL